MGTRILTTSHGTHRGAFAPIDWALFLAVGLIWGSSFLFMAIGLEAFRPGLVTWLRILFGASVLWCFPRTRKRIAREDRPRLAVLAITWVAIPFTLFPLAQGSKHPSSSLPRPRGKWCRAEARSFMASQAVHAPAPGSAITSEAAGGRKKGRRIRLQLPEGRVEPLVGPCRWRSTSAGQGCPGLGAPHQNQRRRHAPADPELLGAAPRGKGTAAGARKLTKSERGVQVTDEVNDRVRGLRREGTRPWMPTAKRTRRTGSILRAGARGRAPRRGRVSLRAWAAPAVRVLGGGS